MTGFHSDSLLRSSCQRSSRGLHGMCSPRRSWAGPRSSSYYFLRTSRCLSSAISLYLLICLISKLLIQYTELKRPINLFFFSIYCILKCESLSLDRIHAHHDHKQSVCVGHEGHHVRCTEHCERRSERDGRRRHGQHDKRSIPPQAS